MALFSRTQLSHSLLSVGFLGLCGQIAPNRIWPVGSKFGTVRDFFQISCHLLSA